MKKRLPHECSICRWVNHCRGGCTKDRPGGRQRNGINYHCEAYKMFFEHADARLNELASLYKAMETPVVTPETEKHSNPAKTRKIGRNDPCPCGSGLKYKHCCLNRGNNVLLS